MTHPLFTHLATLSPAERRERHYELDLPWGDETPPRKPRHHRHPPDRTELLTHAARALGIVDED